MKNKFPSFVRATEGRQTSFKSQIKKRKEGISDCLIFLIYLELEYCYLELIYQYSLAKRAKMLVSKPKMRAPKITGQKGKVAGVSTGP